MRYGQNTSKMSPNGVSPISDPKRFFNDFFFQNKALSLFYPHGALTSCKELEKTNKLSLEITDHRHGWLHRINWGPKYIFFFKSYISLAILKSEISVADF